MAKQERRHYTREFKLEAVKLSMQGRGAMKRVSEDLGVNRTLIAQWKKDFLAEGVITEPGYAPPAQPVESIEVARLRRELAIAQQERDILKKALAYFAKE